MKPAKEKTSVSIESGLAKALAKDAITTAKATFSDLPSEDEWIELQPKW